jgi:hypothetical protein
MEQQIETAFVVTVNTDGTFAAHMEQPETPFEVQRPATAYDILTISQGLVKEIEAGQLTDRIIIALLSVLQGATSTPADAIKEKLKERGIDPESTPVNA